MTDVCPAYTDAHLSMHEPHRQPSRNRLSRGMEAAAATTRRRQSVSLVALRARVPRGEREIATGREEEEKERVRWRETGRTRWISSAVERDGCGKARGAGGYRGEENTGCGTEGVVHIARRLCRGMERGNIHNAPDVHTYMHTCTHTRGKFTNFGRLSRSLHPSPSRRGNPPRHPPSPNEARCLSPSSSRRPYPPLFPLKLPPPSPPILLPVCVYTALYGTYTRTYTSSSVTRVTREPLTHTRESPSYGARRRKYINRPHSRRYRQLLLPPSSRRWVNHRRVCPAC